MRPRPAPARHDHAHRLGPADLGVARGGPQRRAGACCAGRWQGRGRDRFVAEGSRDRRHHPLHGAALLVYPVRTSLEAALLKSGKPEAAEKEFAAALERARATGGRSTGLRSRRRQVVMTQPPRKPTPRSQRVGGVILQCSASNGSEPASRAVCLAKPRHCPLSREVGTGWRFWQNFWIYRSTKRTYSAQFPR